MRHIKSVHSGKKVLAIDSSVGKAADIGKIRVAFGAIAPGSADGKKLPKVGDVSITATVTDLDKAPLSAVRLGIVYSLARNMVSNPFRQGKSNNGNISVIIRAYVCYNASV